MRGDGVRVVGLVRVGRAISKGSRPQRKAEGTSGESQQLVPVPEYHVGIEENHASVREDQDD